MKTLKLLFVAIAAVCCSLVAEAAEPITYLDWDSVQKQMTNATTTSYVVVTNGIEVFEAGTTYVVNDLVTAPFSVFVNGTESEPTILVLCDGGWLTVSRGVEVTDGHKLVICEQADGDEEATRQLTSTGDSHYAGIGGGWNGACGTIVINGGIVNATGGYQSAGIGGGFYGDNKDGGNVTINGGTVNARGHTNAAGIGGANGGAGGTVTINGGMVSGYGGASAAGIGGGYHGAGGTVAINGGMVTGEGGEESGAAGIGAGAYESPMDPGTVTFGPGMDYWILAGTDWSDQVEVSTAEFIADHSAPSVFISSSPLPPGPTAKVVLENGDKTMRFVYDSVDYDSQGKTWYSLADYEETASSVNPEWHAHCGTVTNAVFDPSFAVCKPKKCDSWFYEFTQLVGVEGLENLDTSETTSFVSMFDSCSSLTSLDLSRLDTAKVADMCWMFWKCQSLTQLNLSGFDTAKVTDMCGMFEGCSSLVTIYVSNKFVTTAVEDSFDMFNDCSSLVGGAGTGYDSFNPSDKTYARIDCGRMSDSPGYFTEGQKKIATGAYASLDLVDDLGIEIPEDVDYALGDKVTVKVEGLAKGLKLVTTQQKETTGRKAVTNVIYTIEGVPTETVDFDTQTMYARVSVTYKDKTMTADGTGKLETLQPIPLSIVPAKVRTLAAGVLNEVYEPVDIAELWPEVKDAKVNSTEWSFKGWPAGVKYNATAKDVNWSYKSSDGKSYGAIAVPYTVYGQPTKAGEFPITATYKHLIDGKSVSETFSAVLTVWGDVEAEDEFRYTDQAYVATATKMLAGVTAVSGLPAGIKFDKATASLSGTPTKAGVFAVTATKSDKTKETFLWKIDPPDAPTFALNTGTAPITDLKAQIVQGANQAFAIATSVGAKVTVTGLPTGFKLVQDKTTGLYTVEGVASKPGEYFVTFKTTLNGVTTVTTTAFTVKANPFTAAYYGCALARPATNEAYRLAVAEVMVAAAGTVTLTYTEGKTKYTASVKSFDWDDATDKGTASNIVLKVSSADKTLGYGDRKATLTFEDFGAYVYAKLDIEDANGSSLLKWSGNVFEVVKTTEVPLPASQTFVFHAKDGADTNALATVSVAYDAKKATAAFSGKLYDGTAVKATVPVLRWGDEGTSDDYVLAPFLVIAKDGTVYCFASFSSACDGGYIDWVREDGEDTDHSHSTSADYTDADANFAALVPNIGSFTFGWGSDAGLVGTPTESFEFEVTTDAKGNPAGVAIYDADAVEGEKALATVTAKVGKTTGAISVSFTSKKNDKAKYAVELVWRDEGVFAGHVTRTWKGLVDGKPANLTAYGTAEVK